MQTVVDVAAYILKKYGPMTTMKLQKLAFYSQAYSLAVYGHELFSEDFEAWVNGPVAPDLYFQHRGKFLIHPGELDNAYGACGQLSQQIKQLVDCACEKLAHLTGNELSCQTHNEDPWNDARAGYGPSEHCRNVISKSSIQHYYSRHHVWELS